MEQNRFLSRYLEETAFSESFGRQMRFIAGPRQSGKTTIAKNRLMAVDCELLYYNWDRKAIRRRFREEEGFLEHDILTLPGHSRYWACFDEIHKMPRWKNILKDFFDTYEDRANYIVTGSARLDLFRKAGDSLAGRYFLFKLNPLILPEALQNKVSTVMPEKDGRLFVEKMVSSAKYEQSAMEHILEFSGFPEPFLKGDAVFCKKWHKDYFERIVKEDLRDISHIHMLEKVMDLLYLLPGKIGSPLSLNAIREDLEVNLNTVKNYVKYLVLTYALFEVLPYHKKKSRLVKKEKKVYFYNWLDIADPARRFENYVALELKSRVDLWNDSLPGDYGLYFVRGRDGSESDFLITRDDNPFILFEAKLSEENIASHHYKHVELWGGIPFVQLVKTAPVLRVKEKGFYIISASRFFA